MTRAIRSNSAEADALRSANPGRRLLALVVGLLLVTVVVGGAVYSLATVPLTSRAFSVSIVTTALPPTHDTVRGARSSEPVFLNDPGTAALQLPSGARLTGNWSALGGSPLVEISILYGPSAYSATSSSSGSFALNGPRPFNTPTLVSIFVLSAVPITVGIDGSYTAPIL